MRAPASIPDHGAKHTQFCARCLAGVEAGASCCHQCRAVFAGARRFHVMVGTEAAPLYLRLFLRLPRSGAAGLQLA
jgi:hypothetical protein